MRSLSTAALVANSGTALVGIRSTEQARFELIVHRDAGWPSKLKRDLGGVAEKLGLPGGELGVADQP
jgi:hypothetical protein